MCSTKDMFDELSSLFEDISLEKQRFVLACSAEEACMLANLVDEHAPAFEKAIQKVFVAERLLIADVDASLSLLVNLTALSGGEATQEEMRAIITKQGEEKYRRVMQICKGEGAKEMAPRVLVNEQFSSLHFKLNFLSAYFKDDGKMRLIEASII